MATPDFEKAEERMEAEEARDNLDVDSMIDRILNNGKHPHGNAGIREAEIRELCLMSRDIFMSQNNLVNIKAPIVVCGDTHGQFADLIRIFGYAGYPPEANYLFLGDYVDRGKHSIEVILLLLCYKVKYPENFFLLRGNHELASINRVYGFYDECKRRYRIKLWKDFSGVFNRLPIAAVISHRIFCCHGGISENIDSLDDLNDIHRPNNVEDDSVSCDLLWADPSDKTRKFKFNEERGVSVYFGKDATDEFLERHDLDLICRAHQVVEDGFQFTFGRKVVTVFSAPNYCGEFDNAAGIMQVDEDLNISFKILKPIDGQNRISGSGNNMLTR